MNFIWLSIGIVADCHKHAGRKSRIPQQLGTFSTNRLTISFSRKALFLGVVFSPTTLSVTYKRRDKHRNTRKKREISHEIVTACINPWTWASRIRFHHKTKDFSHRRRRRHIVSLHFFHYLPLFYLFEAKSIILLEVNNANTKAHHHGYMCWATACQLPFSRNSWRMSNFIFQLLFLSWIGGFTRQISIKISYALVFTSLSYLVSRFLTQTILGDICNPLNSSIHNILKFYFTSFFFGSKKLL
jgi:hypothetical protein